MLGLDFLFLGVVIVVIGGGMFLTARSARKHDQERSFWPTVKGTVTSSEVVRPPAIAAGKPDGSGQLDVSIKYQFRAGGQLHFGATVSYPRSLYGKEEADRLVSRFPAGATVTVYHNPEDYRDCYLEIRPTAKNYRTSILIMIVGGIVGLFGILQFFA
jgi:hypothetical protein